VAAAGGVVARRRRRRGRAIVGGELAFIPSPEERVPRWIVVRVEAWVSALLVAHALEDLVDGGVDDVYWRQLLQRAEDDVRGRRRCAEDKTMRTTTDLSRRQVGATRRVGSFLAVPRVFLSSGVPECALEDRGWPGSPDG
jgi:hypothetical protein